MFLNVRTKFKFFGINNERMALKTSTATIFSGTKIIWIDLENSPHVLFFNPIIKELKRGGYKAVVTVRDYAQVIELADIFLLV